MISSPRRWWRVCNPMLALSSIGESEFEAAGRATTLWAVAGLVLGLLAVLLDLAGQFVSELFFLNTAATSCGLAGVVLSSKAYFDAREEGSFSGMAVAGMALNGVSLLGGFAISGFQTLWRAPLVIAVSVLVLRQLRLSYPLTWRGLTWMRGIHDDRAPAADEKASELCLVLTQEEYRRLAVIGLYLGIASLSLTFLPAVVLLWESQVRFWVPFWLMGIRIGFLCHVVGVWFCGLAFLKLLQGGGLTRSAVAGFMVNLALALFLLVGLLTAYFMTVR